MRKILTLCLQPSLNIICLNILVMTLFLICLDIKTANASNLISEITDRSYYNWLDVKKPRLKCKLHSDMKYVFQDWACSELYQEQQYQYRKLDNAIDSLRYKLK